MLRDQGFKLKGSMVLASRDFASTAVKNYSIHLSPEYPTTMDVLK